ncbi:MAG: (2Fe-2S)-binding protein, partial [Pseudohongiellaceae bacterium]
MIQLSVNGESRSLDIEPDMPLLWALRDVLGLTGTKYGCGIAVCGACVVHVDGKPVRACITPVESMQGKAITTIEKISSPAARAVQNAWEQHDVVQCGYCQSGQIMSAIALFENNPTTDDAEISEAMRDNLCRCHTYVRIR